MKKIELPSFEELAIREKERTIPVSFRMKESTWARFAMEAKKNNTNIGSLVSSLADYYVKNELEDDSSDDEVEKILARKKKELLEIKGQKDLSKWEMDVLNCIKEIDKGVFVLSEVYAFKDVLQKEHPKNHSIEAKIRQLLQSLRDKGYIEFIDRGVYKKVC